MHATDASATPMGGCNCGALRYRVTRPVLACYICHCHLCQKRSGSAFSMSVVLPADGLELTQGTALETQRRRPDGKVNHSLVCPDCHSRLITRREGAPTLNLRAGTLDETAWLRPVAQFWTASAQPWAVQRGAILSYAGQPEDYAPMLAAWTAAGLTPAGRS